MSNIQQRSSAPSTEWKSGSRSSTVSYPLPSATYEEVVQNEDVFFEKLKLYHISCGYEFKIPTVGGEALDVHKLFVEVTSRGGIEKVIRNRRWRDVVASFKFPSSVHSASLVLRKFYLSLLYQFEQGYLFHKQIPAAFLPDNMAINSVDEGSQEVHTGSTLTGWIDGKFDNGYLITVCAGGECHRGVLYHQSPSQGSSQPADVKPPPRRRPRKPRVLLRDEGFEYEDWQATE